MKRKTRILTVFIAIAVLAAMVSVAYTYSKKKAEQDAAIKEALLNDVPVAVAGDSDNCETYVFFGSDSRANDESWKSPSGGRITADESGTQGVPRSDVIMLFNVNRDNETIDIVSVYRDTALNKDVDSRECNFQKANKAYADYGPEEACRVLEQNLDIKIKGYAASNFKGVADVIDDLGGVTIDVDDEEILEEYLSNGSSVVDYVNRFIDETDAKYGRNTPHLTHSGVQTLSGSQAVAYARLRNTSGVDMRRSVRQRTVLLQMIEQYRKLSDSEKTELILNNASGIDTNLSLSDLAELIRAVSGYTISTSGFPYYKTGYIKKTGEETGGEAYLYIPCTLTVNVAQFHQKVYDDLFYTPDSTVEEYSKKLIKETAKGFEKRHKAWDNAY